eukprot:11197174-Ditylum_brightwellii.AAC.1
MSAPSYNQAKTTQVAYRPCKQSNPEDSTVNAQQKRLLIQQREINPNLRKTWCKDMIKQIETWANHGEVTQTQD